MYVLYVYRIEIQININNKIHNINIDILNIVNKTIQIYI